MDKRKQSPWSAWDMAVAQPGSDKRDVFSVCITGSLRKPQQIPKMKRKAEVVYVPSL